MIVNLISRNHCRLLLRYICILVLLIAANGEVSNTNRRITVINESNRSVAINWVNPADREESTLAELVEPNEDVVFFSFIGHEFVAHELPEDGGTLDCDEDDADCRSVFFTVLDLQEQSFHINSEFEVKVSGPTLPSHVEGPELVAACQKMAKDRLANAATESEREAITKQALESLVECVEYGASSTLERVTEEITFQASVRTYIAATLENYTCVDDSLNSTADIYQDTWVSEKDGRSRPVHVKHERSASRIHVVENFIDEEECRAMETAAEATLHRAAVADGKGGTRVSAARKAMQAGIKVPWELEQEGDPIARLSRRVYDYVNHVLKLDIKEQGQEDLMSIQYEGRGAEDETPDRYMPHCDGDCNGIPHKWGQRMATMVMYCDVATRGGHTNFLNAGVHVKPRFGDAIFFSYIDPELKVMDTGFTQHSGCPVFEGHKKIVTQWVRFGVDEQYPWDSFNTLGIHRSELEDIDFYDESESGTEEINEDLLEKVLQEDDDDFDNEDGEEFTEEGEELDDFDGSDELDQEMDEEEYEKYLYDMVS